MSEDIKLTLPDGEEVTWDSENEGIERLVTITQHLNEGDDEIYLTQTDVRLIAALINA